MSAIQRESVYLVTTIEAGEAESTAVEFYPYGGGLLLIPDAWTDANLGFKVSHLDGGDFNPLKDEAGTIVEVGPIATAEAGWYNLPLEVFGARFIKLWSKTTASGVGTDTNQAADRSIYLMLKS